MENLTTYLNDYGYLFLFWYSMGGGFIGLVLASIFATQGVGLEIHWVILVAFAGNFLGDNLLVWVMRYQKKDIAPYIAKYKRQLALCRLWIGRYPYGIIFVQKFLYGIKTFIPIMVGLSKYNFKKFIILNFFASIAFALGFGLGGYFLGQTLTGAIQAFEEYAYVPFVVLVVLLIGFAKWTAHITKKKLPQ